MTVPTLPSATEFLGRPVILKNSIDQHKHIEYPNQSKTTTVEACNAAVSNVHADGLTGMFAAADGWPGQANIFLNTKHWWLVRFHVYMGSALVRLLLGICWSRVDQLRSDDAYMDDQGTWSSLQNKIWNLSDRNTNLPKFIYGKEGKLAGPTQVLPVRVVVRH